MRKAISPCSRRGRSCSTSPSTMRGLLPKDANARARAITWMFAALSTVEPPILELGTARMLESDKPWSEERLPCPQGSHPYPAGAICRARLGDADWLDGAFSAGDLMMVSVLLRMRSSGFWTNIQIWPPMSPAAKRGPPICEPSRLNWRLTPSHRAADCNLSWVRSRGPIISTAGAWQLDLNGQRS